MHNAEMKSQNLLSALLIDHDDSFTENIKKWLSAQFNVTIIHYSKIKFLDQDSKQDETKSSNNLNNYDLIILSPGPLSPIDYSMTLNFLLTLDPFKSILGICLGMQMMTVALHGQVKTYFPPKHGKTSSLDCQNLHFNTLSLNGVQIARYHSMYCELPLNEFDVIATSENLPMWIKHKFKNWMGFQFHPESFLTEKADIFLDVVFQWTLLNQRRSH